MLGFDRDAIVALTMRIKLYGRLITGDCETEPICTELCEVLGCIRFDTILVRFWGQGLG